MVMPLLYGLAALGLIIAVLQLAALRACVGAKRGREGRFTPPVSILKPLKGIDDNLFDNLESFCSLDYPEYEIIFALRSADDPAYKVARKVKDRHPEKDIRIVAEWCDEGLNPKVNNLTPAYRVSKYGFILISDSNVLVDKDYLKDTVRQMEDAEVGLVSNLIRGIRGRTLGSTLENMHLNSFIAGGVCFLEKFMRRPCVVGKSMLIRKEFLEELGGFGSVKDHLAEDYILGRKMKEAGRKVVLSNHIINTVNEYWQVRQFMARHARWGRLRWRIGGPSYLLELIANPGLMALVPLVIYGPTRVTVTVSLTVWTLKAGMDYITGRLVGSDIHALFYLLSPVKDLLIGLVWFVPIFSNKVEWRGDRYIICKDSLLQPYEGCHGKSIVAY